MKIRYIGLLSLMVLLGAGCNSAAPVTPASPAPADNAAGAPVTITAPAAAAPKAETVPAGIINFSFQPQTLTVASGTTVVWTNNDSAPHTVTSDGGSFGSDTLSPGASFVHTFSAAGTFSYHCNIHKSMQAKVIVQ